MSGFSNTIQSGKDKVFGFADDLSNVLDFGNNAPANEPIKPENPEKDITEIERANPVNVHFAPFGLHPAVLIGAGLLVTFVVLKKTKVI